MRSVRRIDNLATVMCRLSGNSRSLSVLEPQGPVQAWNGIAFSCTSFFNMPHKENSIARVQSWRRKGPESAAEYMPLRTVNSTGEFN